MKGVRPWSEVRSAGSQRLAQLVDPLTARLRGPELEWLAGRSPMPLEPGRPMAAALVAAIGTTHQDYRFRRNSGGELSPEVDAVTSNVPFLALFTGQQSWKALGEEMKWLNAAVALLGTGLLAISRRGRRFR